MTNTELYDNKMPIDRLLQAENVRNVLKSILDPNVRIEDGIVRKGGSSSTINVKKEHEGKRYTVLIWPTNK